MGTLKQQSNGPDCSNTVIVTLAADGWAVAFGTARWVQGGQRPGLPTTHLAVPNQTANPSAASVPTSYYSMCHLPVPIVNWLISYSTLQTVFEKQWPRSAKYELNCLGLMTCSCFQITVISVDILHIDGRSSRPHYYYLYTRGVNSGQQLARNATDKTPFILLLLLELNSTLIFYSKLLWIYTVFRKKHPLLFPCITLRSINRLK